ncbi:MAG: hypothetical protein LBB07_02200 [Bifidobacteriaceae bacterium]|jgi:hypothetical protein|nr:hypothetical protein [Bifidobacteriaceae bacterium]
MKKLLIVGFTILGCLSLILGSGILFRYQKQQMAKSEYYASNYVASANDFDTSEIFPYEPWKEYFNKGTSYLQMNNYNDARDNFQISFSIAPDNQAKCIIANNWAAVYEKNAANYEDMLKTTKSDAVKKAIISFLTQASILRNQQQTLCQNSDANFLQNLALQTNTDTNQLNSYTQNSNNENNSNQNADKSAQNNQNELQNQNTGGISEYLNAYDLVNGSTDFQGKKW